MLFYTDTHAIAVIKTTEDNYNLKTSLSNVIKDVNSPVSNRAVDWFRVTIARALGLAWRDRVVKKWRLV